MADHDTVEGWLTTPDGHKLYTKSWTPTGNPKARLVFLHGFSDHCNCYPFLFPSLARQGIKVFSYDQRGWGRSVHDIKQRGVTGPNEQIMADITTFIKSLPSSESAIPLFLMGHSMGGGETIAYAATGPKEVLSQIRGFLLEAPLIGLVAKPWKATLVLGRLASKVMPHATMLQKLDASLMSRDPEVCKAWQEDELNHDTGTLEGLAAMMDRTGDIGEGRMILQEGVGEGGKTRLWISHGTGDKICDFQGSKRWLDNLQIEDKEFKEYDGWYHKLHAEPGDDKERFANDVAKWILDRAGPLPATAKSKL
jgi:acylglycerol lipase